MKELLTKINDNKLVIELVNDELKLFSTGTEIKKELLVEIKDRKLELIHFLKSVKYEEGAIKRIQKIEEHSEGYVLSSSQKRLWILSQIEDGNTAYNIPGFYLFEGDLNSDAIEYALQKIVDRHEILRTVFIDDQQGGVKQYVKSKSEIDFKLFKEDLTDTPEKETILKNSLNEQVNTPFNLLKGPLLKANLYKLAENKHVFAYIMHHIISDGWSMEILVKELLMYYNSYLEGGLDVLQPLELQFKDYAAWQQEQLTGSNLESNKKYWKQQFEGNIPTLNLPIDHPRPLHKTFNSGVFSTEIDIYLTKKIKDICSSEGTTLFVGVLTLMNCLFHKYTHQEDIIIGVPVAGRNHEDLDNQIGFYVNTLALRTRFQKNNHFIDVLNNIKKVTLEAYNHQEYPFDEIIEDLNLKRDMSRNALFDVMVGLQNKLEEQESFQLGNLQVKNYEIDESSLSLFDMTISFVEVSDKLIVNIAYNSDLFEIKTIEKMGENMIQFLNEIILTPQKPIEELADFIVRKESEKSNEIEIIKEIIPPSNEIETKLRSIWSKILNIEEDQISISDNFFLLGGLSLRVMKLLSRIHKEFEVKLELKKIFATNVLKDQALLIQESNKNKLVFINKIPEQESYKLSSSQKRLWVLSQFEDSNVAYNIPGTYVFKGDLNKEAIDHAVYSIIERHEILRTVFDTDEKGELRQFIKSSKEINLSVFHGDLRTSDDKQNRINTIIDSETTKAFNLKEGPLLRCSLYQLDEDEFVFIYVMHHIISDGWSMGLLVKELLLFYNSYLAGVMTPLQPLRIQYKDFAYWQQNHIESTDVNKHKAYWINQFSGDLPVLEFPVDNNRNTIKSFNGNSVDAKIEKPFMQMLKNSCDDIDATVFMGLMAVVNGLLYRYTNQDDIIIGIPIAGREHVDLENQIGFYVNTLAIRTKIDSESNFKELLKATKKVALEAYEHQVFPFDELVESLGLKRDMSRNPIFDVMVTYHKSEKEEGLNDQLNNVEINTVTTKSNQATLFDLTFNFHEIEEELFFSIEYNSDLFQQSTIEQLVSHFIAFIKAIENDPAQSIQKLKYLSEAEQNQLLVSFNDTQSNYPKSKTIIELFQEQVKRTPHNQALIQNDFSLSYEELEYQTNQFSSFLQLKHQIKKGDLVGIHLDKSVWSIISLLAIIKVGGIYLPIDISYPTERVKYMMSNSNCSFLITENEINDFKKNQNTFSKVNFNESSKNPDDSVCVIYTSGSTGNPKGVLIKQKNIIRLVKNTNYIELTNTDTILSLVSFSFDGALFDFFGSLLNGGTLVLTSKNDSIDFQVLEALINKNKITVFLLTTTLFNAWVDNGLPNSDTLRAVLFGGEQASLFHVQKFIQESSAIELINVYGPTENTTYSTTYTIGKDILSKSSVPIGKPINNSRVYILDNQFEPVPIGVIGEIYVAGDGISNGYLNNDKLTGERFLRNPFENDGVMYKTGDKGKYRSDGNIEYYGREDDQVKIRGFRIELGEIETEILKYETIESTVVKIDDEFWEEKKIVAFITGRSEINILNLKKQLKTVLPDYMIPFLIIQVDSIPLTPNGKIDKKAMNITKEMVKLSENELIHPRNNEEVEMLEIWKDVLNIKNTDIGIRSDFFEIGGHSLIAIKLKSKIKEILNKEVKIQDIYNFPTIESLLLFQKSGNVYKTINLNNNTQSENTLIFIPPISGNSIIYKSLAEKIKGYKCIGWQYPGIENNEEYFDSIEKAAQVMYDELPSLSGNGKITIVGFSMGALIGFEFIKKIEKTKKSIEFIVIDRDIIDLNQNKDSDTQRKKDSEALVELYKNEFGLEESSKINLENFIYNNLKVVDNYIPNGKIKSTIHVFQSKENKGIADMKNWENFTTSNIDIREIEGDHWDALMDVNHPHYIELLTKLTLK